jgi:hypothetical protein
MKSAMQAREATPSSEAGAAGPTRGRDRARRALTTAQEEEEEEEQQQQGPACTALLLSFAHWAAG